MQFRNALATGFVHGRQKRRKPPPRRLPRVARFSRTSASANVIEASTVSFRMDRRRGFKGLGRGAFRWAAAAYLMATTGIVCWAGSSPILTAVKARGSLVCGVNEGLPGFSYVDERGIWTGFDVDFCRAIAAAIFGDPKKVKLAPLTADARFQALRDGKIDVLARNSTWTMGRETEFGLTFVGVTYYDGQGFMLPRALHVNSALELDGAKVCVQSGTTTIDNLADFFTSNGMTLQEVISSSTDESIKNYDGGLCSVLTSDLSQLYALRLRLAKPRDQVILPDVISKEPLGPVVRDNDLQWISVVKWVYFAMINAEELGVSSRTIDQAMRSQKPEVKRLVGTSGDFGEEIGLTNAWASNIIRYVGNYGEVFERNLGAKTPLAIPRGLNQLWNDGGIQYAPPIR
jgi:general L-amino acid transport system substrate-binding protein